MAHAHAHARVGARNKNKVAMHFSYGRQHHRHRHHYGSGSAVISPENYVTSSDYFTTREWELDFMKASFPISYEILPSRGNRPCGFQNDYNPGIMSDTRPQIFSEQISESEWADRVTRFNQGLRSFWSCGSGIRTCCTICARIPPFQCLPFLTMPCICFFDEEGSLNTGIFKSCICFRNRLRKSALLELQPLCDLLSDDKLVWSMSWADDDVDSSSSTIVNRAGFPVVAGRGSNTSTSTLNSTSTTTSTIEKQNIALSDGSSDTAFLYCGELFQSDNHTIECSDVSRRQW